MSRAHRFHLPSHPLLDACRGADASVVMQNLAVYADHIAMEVPTRADFITASLALSLREDHFSQEYKDIYYEYLQLLNCLYTLGGRALDTDFKWGMLRHTTLRYLYGLLEFTNAEHFMNEVLLDSVICDGTRSQPRMLKSLWYLPMRQIKRLVWKESGEATWVFLRELHHILSSLPEGHTFEHLEVALSPDDANLRDLEGRLFNFLPSATQLVLRVNTTSLPTSLMCVEWDRFKDIEHVTVSVGSTEYRRKGKDAGQEVMIVDGKEYRVKKGARVGLPESP